MQLLLGELQYYN